MTHPCLQSDMRNTVKKMFLVLLLLVGVGILLYPKISDYVNRIHSSSAMQSVSQKVHNTSREDLERQLALAWGYNEALLQKLETIERCDHYKDKPQEAIELLLEARRRNIPLKL